MPRGPRLDAPGAVHHVMMRGLERRRIFVDDDDRHDLLERLDRVLTSTDTGCLAWALMPNHVHLVLRTGAVHLSRLLARINTGYAVRFNRRHERAGYLFQNRFKSRMARDDADALGLVRYVHLNPLEDGIVGDLAALATHPWCGHPALVGTRAAYAFEAVVGVAALFGGPARGRVARFVEWMREGVPQPASGAGTCQDAMPGPAGCAFEDETSGTRDAPARRPKDPAWLESWVRHACADLGVCEADLRGPLRPRWISNARSQICRRAVFELGYTAADVGRALGVTREAVRQALSRPPQPIPRGEGRMRPTS